MKLKGITVGTYISKRSKGKFDESICASCVNNKNKNIDKEKQYELCKGCDKFYVSKTCKAVLTTGRDQTTDHIYSCFQENSKKLECSFYYIKVLFSKVLENSIFLV